MNTKYNTSNRHPICDVLASHVDDFLSDLKEIGYPLTHQVWHRCHFGFAANR